MENLLQRKQQNGNDKKRSQTLPSTKATGSGASQPELAKTNFVCPPNKGGLKGMGI